MALTTSKEIPCESPHRISETQEARFSEPAVNELEAIPCIELRDWLAGMALNGLSSNATIMGASIQPTAAGLAGLSYDLADAMLAARDK